MVPKEPSNYRQVKETMKRLNYTPRPMSEHYPGQYKVLRRKGQNNFNRGVRLMGRIATYGLVVYGIFFYRWNDGYDNIFSLPYRFQLRAREHFFSNLSDEQKEDLQGKQRGMVKKVKEGNEGLFKPAVSPDTNIALERPSRSHVIEAERRMQEREEAILRAVDIAQAKLESQSQSKSKWWPF